MGESGNESLFSIGSEIVVTPMCGEDFEAEVMSYDSATRMMCLRKPSKGGKSTVIDIYTIHSNYVKGIKMKKEATSEKPDVPEIEPKVFQKRLELRVAERTRLATAVNDKVSLDARKLFHKMGKVFDPDLKADINADAVTRWNSKQEIIVMNTIAITPPYTEDCVVPYNAKNSENTAKDIPGLNLDYVKKLVKKYYVDKENGSQKEKAKFQQKEAASIK